MSAFVYLASQSPRRAELLNQLGVRFVPLKPDPDEDSESLEAQWSGESARHYVQRVTALKAGAALVRLKVRKLADAPILAADTTVAVGRTILGKPADAADARRMLTLLSGRSHRVLTAVALARGRRLDMLLSESRVNFRVLKRADIEAYIQSGEPFGKAGAYAIQGRAATFVTHISGSQSGIVGLPLCETALLLERFGVALWSTS